MNDQIPMTNDDVRSPGFSRLERRSTGSHGLFVSESAGKPDALQTLRDKAHEGGKTRASVWSASGLPALSLSPGDAWVIGHSLVIGHWSLVIGHWSFAYRSSSFSVVRF